MDILYYSNLCKHSQKTLQFLAKKNLTDKISFICIDKRKIDPKTNQIIIYLENGKSAILPPSIHSVPSLLLINDKYRLVLGEDIIKHYEPVIQNKNNEATGFNGEPTGYFFYGGSPGSNIMSEKFTPYNLSPEDLSAKGSGSNRSLYNYVKSTHDVNYINAPQETYNKNKMSEEINIGTLEEKRNKDIPQIPLMQIGGELPSQSQKQNNYL